MRRIFTWKTILCLVMGIAGFSVPSQSVVSASITDLYIPDTFRFTKDLRLNTSVAPDVAYLQNLLNLSTSTQVATTGIGSNKNLSSYYGSKTQDAVGRFQKIFAVDIEYERSVSTSSATSTTVISSSTVDVFTRAVLNKLIIIYTGDRRRYYEERTTGVYASTTEESFYTEQGVETTAPTQTSGSNTNSGSTGGSSNSSSGGLGQKPHELIYKGKELMFKYSPQGQLLHAIGGDSLVSQVFSHTPAGKVGQLTGSGGSGGSGIAAALGIGAGAAALGGAGSAATGLMNFGGRSTAMTTCTCSSNLLIYVQDVRGMNLPLIYQPGVTMLYQMYRPTSGVNMLGSYVTGGQCLIYSGTTCTSGGTPVGTMTKLGTSLAI